MASSKSCSNLEEENVYGFKIWKWKFSLKLGQDKPACCKKAKELEVPATGKAIKRDSSWEFFRFGAVRAPYITEGACPRHKRNLDIIRDRSRSVANLYYQPLDRQADTDDEEDPNLSDESHLYTEIKDAPWIKKKNENEEVVEIEPLPMLMPQLPVSTPRVPKKAPRVNRTYIEVVPPQLPPYPSSKATSSGGRRRHLTGK